MMAAQTNDNVINEPRFNLVDDDFLKEFVESADSQNTKKQIKYAVSIFEDFCKAAIASPMQNTAMLNLTSCWESFTLE